MTESDRVSGIHERITVTGEWRGSQAEAHALMMIAVPVGATVEAWDIETQDGETLPRWRHRWRVTFTAPRGTAALLRESREDYHGYVIADDVGKMFRSFLTPVPPAPAEPVKPGEQPAIQLLE